ncbi:CopG family ribbon-helix-helix protein [Nostoc sp. CENA543]|uniref:CopG family ribbon-helix-helix protein n=1 Tax=Nostoc sp. CENA543 TaxID=1869241 RepID=UPI0012FFF0B5|nr:hypothetical protein [Nostoc sp. CENA543]
MAKVKTNDMTLRLPEELDQQIKAASQVSGISKHQFIINAIKDTLAGQVYQSLEVAQQVKEQLEGDRPITDVAIDIKNALDMLQAQIHNLKEENKLIREEIAKKNDEPEYHFKPGFEVTKQSTKLFSLLMTSRFHTQEWARDGIKRNTETLRYHYDLDIITRETRTKSGRIAFKVVAADLEELQVSPDGHFISPLGSFGYDPEQWAKEEEEVKNLSGNRDPYKYFPGEDEEVVSFNHLETFTNQYLHERFNISYKELINRHFLDICIDGVWTSFGKDYKDEWHKSSYVRTINYDAKAIEVQIEQLEKKIRSSEDVEERKSLHSQQQELKQKLQDLYHEPARLG